MLIGLLVNVNKNRIRVALIGLLFFAARRIIVT